MRVGDWKLVRFHREGAWELYNLGKDRTELHDLAASEPGRAQELAAQWNAWAKRTNVIPYPNETTGKKAGKKSGKGAEKK